MIIAYVLVSLPEFEVKFEMGRLPTSAENQMAIKRINTVELLKVKSENVKHDVFDFITECWHGPPLPNDWVNGTIVYL